MSENQFLPTLCTFYSDSHSELYEQYFVPSLPNRSLYNYIVEKHPQVCQSGEFMSSDWMKAMRLKVQFVIDVAEEMLKPNATFPRFLIHSDVDVQFFSNDLIFDLKKQLLDHDIVGMDDNMLCAGFFAMYVTEKTVKMWKIVYENITNKYNDQIVLNMVLGQNPEIRAGLLPRFRYYNCMHSLGREYKPGDNLKLGTDKLLNMKAHHANYTVGTENKKIMMDHVRDLVQTEVEKNEKRFEAPAFYTK